MLSPIWVAVSFTAIVALIALHLAIKLALSLSFPQDDPGFVKRIDRFAEALYYLAMGILGLTLFLIFISGYEAIKSYFA